MFKDLIIGLLSLNENWQQLLVDTDNFYSDANHDLTKLKLTLFL